MARADFEPIALTPESFNQDIVVENTAPAPAGRVTRASMDGGTNNTGATWYEVGYNLSAPTTGIPAAGTTFTHATLPDHQYAMAPSFSAPNVILIATNTSTNATFTFSAPATYSSLSLLASSGGSASTIGYTVRYADETTQSGTVTVGDWFNGANPAWTANGRVNAQSFGFDNVNNNNPRLYSYDIALANTASAVTAIDITFGSGGGRVAVFAVSGAPAGGGNWSPIAVTGYTHDMVVEAGAPQPGAMRTVTTASMDGGTNNTGNTWFERGYDPYNPNVGLPPAGSTLTSTSLVDHHYLMPASYTAPNVVMVDSNFPIANLTLADPAAYSALSFLSATANGTVTNQCIMQFADGTSETNTFLSRDWFNNDPFAFVARGRVNLNDRSFNNINANNPRLYEAQFALGNTTSPVTNVVLKWIGGSATSRAVVFAVSGTAGAVAPLFTTQPLSFGTYEGSNVVFAATVAGTPPFGYRWQFESNGAFADLEDNSRFSGATTTNLAIAGITLQNAGRYRLVTSNSVGSATSTVATVTVLLSVPDVTAPGDVITGFGGIAPDNESVDHVIDNAAQKYLNFGSGPNANNPPFVGPVGFVVTPAAGRTVLSGIRFYTANDGVERDPASFSIEGSLDGGATYTLIASNALALPDGRNPGGAAAIDPVTQFLQQVLLTNTTGYDQYRVTFPTVKNAAAANSMQIAEVELLGVVVPRAPVLKIVREADGTVTISSSVPANLQSTTELKGAQTEWEEFGPVSEGDGALTFTVAPGEVRFYRAVLP
jgi:hypothetical protein